MKQKYFKRLMGLFLQSKGWRAHLNLDSLALDMPIKHTVRASVANMPNAKYLAHLAHQTQKTKFYQMFQISKNITHSYSNVLNMRRYGQKWYKF